VQSFRGHNGSINAIKMTGDGALVASVGTDKAINFWDYRQSACVMSLDAQRFSEMNDITFKSDSVGSSGIGAFGSLAVVAHNDGALSFWDLGMRKLAHSVQQHQGETRAVSFDQDYRHLASAGFDSTIKILDMESMQLVKTLYHDDKVVNVKWHPYSPILLSTSADKTARLWSL